MRKCKYIEINVVQLSDLVSKRKAFSGYTYYYLESCKIMHSLGGINGERLTKAIRI